MRMIQWLKWKISWIWNIRASSEFKRIQKFRVFEGRTNLKFWASIVFRFMFGVYSSYDNDSELILNVIAEIQEKIIYYFAVDVVIGAFAVSSIGIVPIVIGISISAKFPLQHTIPKQILLFICENSIKLNPLNHWLWSIMIRNNHPWMDLWIRVDDFLTRIA